MNRINGNQWFSLFWQHAKSLDTIAKYLSKADVASKLSNSNFDNLFQEIIRLEKDASDAYRFFASQNHLSSRISGQEWGIILFST
jgi:hypothetical protein